MTLNIVRGLPGSGKSTFVKNTKNIHDKHYEADMYHIKNGVYQFEGSRIKYAHRWCYEQTEIALASGYVVWVSNTFTTMKELNPYIDLAKERGIEYTIYRMTGDYGNIHNVPEETIDKMKNRFVDVEGEILV